MNIRRSDKLHLLTGDGSECVLGGGILHWPARRVASCNKARVWSVALTECKVLLWMRRKTIEIKICSFYNYPDDCTWVYVDVSRIAVVWDYRHM